MSEVKCVFNGFVGVLRTTTNEDNSINYTFHLPSEVYWGKHKTKKIYLTEDDLQNVFDLEGNNINF